MLAAELWAPTDPPLLIDSIVSSSPTETISQVLISDQSRFLNEEGRVPIWFGLEYATQTIMLHNRLVSKNAGSVAIEGHFGKASSIEYLGNNFSIAEILQIAVTRVGEKDGNILFKCQISVAEEPKVRVLINYYQPHQAYSKSN